MACPCPNKKCARHANCDACRRHHLGEKRPTYCRRKRGGKRAAAGGPGGTKAH